MSEGITSRSISIPIVAIPMGKKMKPNASGSKITLREERDTRIRKREALISLPFFSFELEPVAELFAGLGHSSPDIKGVTERATIDIDAVRMS